MGSQRVKCIARCQLYTTERKTGELPNWTGGKSLITTPVFWPGEFHGLYGPRGCKESDTVEWLSLSIYLFSKRPGMPGTYAAALWRLMRQFFGLCGRGRGWDDLGEWHWNMYNIIYETSHQSRFDARYWMLGAGALGRPRRMVWGGRRVQDGEHMCTCGRFISMFSKTNTIL